MQRVKLVLNRPLLMMATDGSESIKLKENVPYVLNPDTFNSIKDYFGAYIDSFEEIIFENKTTIEKAKKILVWRSGGIGDILFTFPYLTALKEKNNFLRIDYVTMEKNIPIVNMSLDVHKVLAEPLELTPDLLDYDYYIILNNFIENNPNAELLNAFDVGEEFFGIKRIEPPFQSRIETSLPVLKEGKKIHIAIAFSASVPIRNISYIRWWDLLRSLDASMFRVSMISLPSQQPIIADTLENVKRFNPELEVNPVFGKSIKDIIDLFLRADVPHMLIGTDSGLPNLFGFQGIPVIGLFGPFPSDLRLRYYKYAIGIDTISKCSFSKNDHSDCFQHGNGSCKLAIAKKEINAPCLSKIDTSYIINAIYVILKRVYNYGN